MLTNEERDAIETRQREIATEIADKLLSGEPLTEGSRGFAAAILREWATRPKDKRDGRRRSKFDKGAACRDYAWKVGKEGIGVTDAADLVSDTFNVSRQAIIDAVNENKANVDSLIKRYLSK